LFTKRPAQVDDLKLISGVGPKLEKTCHEIGVYQFAQVANWKKADIKTVDDKLSFKGRIERDEWVKQAKILAKGGETAFSKKSKK
jgi:NADH-quinone oxidoreductase subunit E